MENIDIEALLQRLVELSTTYGLRIIVAILILIAGRVIAGSVAKSIRKVMGKREMDPALTNFLASLARIAILAFTVITILGQLGIPTASFAAVIAAAGLAIGLALQGSLSNFAAGVMLLIFRPFRIGDAVEVAGTSGSVREIGIFTTTLASWDNKKVIIPNAQITGDTITNITANDTRRVDMVAGIGYGDDIAKAKGILERILREHQLVLQEPAPQVELVELADSSVNFVVRPWCKTSDYWRVHFDVTRSIKEEFDKAGVSIPFPQRDVHLFQESAAN